MAPIYLCRRKQSLQCLSLPIMTRKVAQPATYTHNDQEGRAIKWESSNQRHIPIMLVGQHSCSFIFLSLCFGSLRTFLNLFFVVAAFSSWLLSPSFHVCAGNDCLLVSRVSAKPSSGNTDPPNIFSSKWIQAEANFFVFILAGPSFKVPTGSAVSRRISPEEMNVSINGEKEEPNSERRLAKGTMVNWVGIGLLETGSTNSNSSHLVWRDERLNQWWKRRTQFRKTACEGHNGELGRNRFARNRKY